LMPEIEAKGNEISDRIQQLKAKSSLLVNNFFFPKTKLSFLSIRHSNMLYIEKII
jgi:hypothetical protein